MTGPTQGEQSVSVNDVRLEMLDELMTALGMSKHARPQTPLSVWREALDKVRELASVRGERDAPPHVVMPSPGAWLDWRPVEELTDEELERQSQDSLTFISGGSPIGTLAMEEHSKVMGRGFAIDREVRRRAREVQRG